ncbi:copper chaperone PCu(A)C [Rhodobacteraceae bacterium]|nr:copper chaperone PCu(A)C [Paracoccaceae bacterium]
MNVFSLFAVATALIVGASFASAGDVQHGNKHDAHDETAMDHVQHGDLVLTGAYVRATLPNQPVAGAFLTIENTGTEDEMLVGVSADFAGRGEVHEMKMVDDTMQMRKLDAGLVIPAGETVTLEPGGYHLMFMKLDQAMVEGETVNATLEFENTGPVTTSFNVEGKVAKRGEHDHGS